MNQSSESQPTFDYTKVTTYQAGVVQAAMHRMLQKESDEYLKEFGISKMQWLIIGSVLDAGEEGMRITELAEIMQTGLPYLTTSINLLVSMGILVRTVSEEDARSKRVRVTEDFQKKCPEIERVLRKGLRESIYSKVSPEEFATYMKVLYTLGGVVQ